MKDRILVIHDDPWTSSMLALFLVAEGFDVEVARDAWTAREKLDAAAPSVILLKLGVGGWHQGWECAFALRARHVDLPLVLLADARDPEQEALAMALEPQGYFVKPYELRGLADTINALLWRPEVA